MSWSPALDPDIPLGDAVDAIETVIVPRARDLGGFEVRRALPSARRQMVGPFIFFLLWSIRATRKKDSAHDRYTRKTPRVLVYTDVKREAAKGAFV